MFAIDADNGIRAMETNAFLDAADLLKNERMFPDLAGLEQIATERNWSKADVTEVWNSFAGSPEFSDLKPCKMFRDRPYGLQRIWEAIQRLLPESEQAKTNPAPESKVKTKPAGKLKTPREKSSKPRKTEAKAGKKAKEPRSGTKREEVVRLISRANGATQAEIMDKMGWQPHTVRGFISTLGSKYGVKVQSRLKTSGLFYKVV